MTTLSEMLKKYEVLKDNVIYIDGVVKLPLTFLDTFGGYELIEPRRYDAKAFEQKQPEPWAEVRAFNSYDKSVLSHVEYHVRFLEAAWPEIERRVAQMLSKFLRSIDLEDRFVDMSNEWDKAEIGKQVAAAIAQERSRLVAGLRTAVKRAKVNDSEYLHECFTDIVMELAEEDAK